MIKDLILYFKYQRIIRDVLDNTDFIKALSLSFGVEFKRDRINRIYTVINPYIQHMGESGNNVIYDDNKPIVDKWVLDNFLVIDMVLKDHSMFDILSYNIEKLDDDLNFSLVIQNILLPTAFKAFKRISLIILSILILLIIVGLITL